MKLRIGFSSIDHKVSGERFVGKNEVLVRQADDLTSRRVWSKEGYTIKKFLPTGTFLQFHLGMEEMFRKCVQKAGIEVDPGFRIKDYHLLIKDDEELHLKVLEQTRRLQWFELPIHISIIEEVVSEILSIPVKSVRPLNGERVFHLQVIRPGKPDYIPLHRDAWGDEHTDAVNIYVPIAGSNSKSSLIVAPGSHFWPEHRLTRTKQGAVMNGVQYDTPGLIESEIPLMVERPNPGVNQVMVFSPYMLHGAAANQNKNSTRISLEMRFWRKKSR